MAEFFPQMAAQGQGFFCIRPFMAGLLTDQRIDRDRLASGDRFRDERWDAAYERLDLLKAAFGSEVTSWTTFAIKFALAHPIVTSLIVGLNSVAQVDGVLDAADGNYPDQEVVAKALDIFRSEGMISS